MTTATPTRLRRTLVALGFMSLGAVGTLGLQATASPSGDRGPGMHERHRGGPDAMGGLKALGRAMGQLELDEAQQAELAAAKEDIRARMEEVRAGGHDPAGLKDAVVDGTLTREAVVAAIEEGAERRVDLALYVADRVMDVYEGLTPAQRTELGALVAEHAEQREARRGERRERMRQHLDETE